LKLGLSTWSLLSMDVYSAVRVIGDAGFEYIELWGEVPHAYHDFTDKRRLRDALSTYNMLLTMHAPFTDLNPASSFQPVKGAVERTLSEFVKFGEYLGATVITIHPGSVHNEGLVPRSAQNSVMTLRRMVRASEGRLAISVENQTKSRSKYHFPLASTMESLQLILAEVDGIHFTLDTGHAHVNGQEPLAMAESVGSTLIEIHLSDNMGASDDHLIPGAGDASLDPLLKHVSSTDVLLCLELDPHRYTEEEVLKAASETKTKLQAGQQAPI
jgi:sugar phosphate isomerase/epimerase